MGTEAPPSDNLYVSDLPPNCTEEMIRTMFGPTVTQCRVLPPKWPNQTFSVALVRFSSTREAMTVRETLHGAVPPGQTKPVFIRYSNTGKPDGEKGKAGKGGGDLGAWAMGSGYGPMFAGTGEASD